MYLIREEGAYGLIDLILFSPLFLLVFVAGIDAGSAMLNQAALRRVFSETLNEQGVYKEMPSYLNFEQGEYVFDEKALGILLDKIESRMQALVQRKLGPFNSAESSFKAKLGFILLEIDQRTGQILSFEKKLFRVLPASNANFDLHAELPSYPYLAEDEFILRELSSEVAKSPSKYASGLGYQFEAGEEHFVYLSKSALLYLDFEALSAKSSAGLKNVFSRLYGFKEQGLAHIRTPLN